MCQVEVLQVHDEDQDRVDDCRNVEQGLDQDVTGDLSSLRISVESRIVLTKKERFPTTTPTDSKNDTHFKSGQKRLKNNSLNSLV